MKTLFLIVLLFMGAVTINFAQKLDFSCYLVSSDCLQMALDDSGDVYVGFTTDSQDFPATLKYAEPNKSWTNCLWKFNLPTNNIIH